MSAKRRGAGPGGGRALQGFGRALQALREGAGLTQGEICRRTGVSRAAFSRYESGETWPRLERLDAILSAMDKDVLDLGLALYREQAEAKGREGRAFDRPDLLASPVGRQILDHSRMLFYTGSFWIDAALGLLPMAKERTRRPAEGPEGEIQGETEATDARSGTG